jgi:hypothetical protein
MDRVVAFRTKSELHAALRAEARRRQVSVSRLLHDLVVQAIAREGTPAEGRRAA